jgi:hypothetical protein
VRLGVAVKAGCDVKVGVASMPPALVGTGVLVAAATAVSVAIAVGVAAADGTPVCVALGTLV